MKNQIKIARIGGALSSAAMFCANPAIYAAQKKKEEKAAGDEVNDVKKYKYLRTRRKAIGDEVEYGGIKYIYLGNGPKATGAEYWNISKKLHFRCVKCGYMMSGDCMFGERDAHCLCGKLYFDMGRFGSRLGNDAIEVYERK